MHILRGTDICVRSERSFVTRFQQHRIGPCPVRLPRVPKIPKHEIKGLTTMCTYVPREATGKKRGERDGRRREQPHCSRQRGKGGPGTKNDLVCTLSLFLFSKKEKEDEEEAFWMKRKFRLFLLPFPRLLILRGLLHILNVYMPRCGGAIAKTICVRISLGFPFRVILVFIFLSFSLSRFSKASLNGLRYMCGCSIAYR